MPRIDSSAPTRSERTARPDTGLLGDAAHGRRSARARRSLLGASGAHLRTAERLRRLAGEPPCANWPGSDNAPATFDAAQGGNPSDPTQDNSFGFKVHNFWRLLKERPAYRRTMLAAWTDTAGNGMLNASYMALLASMGGNSTSRSFLAIAIQEVGQTAVFGAVNIFGSHRIDSARPINDVEDARRRGAYLRELRSLCFADIGVGFGLVSVGFAVLAGGATPLILTGALVGLRLCLACKSVYELSLFPCVRQLLGQEALGDLITPADRMIPSLEGMASYMTSELVSCIVQFTIFSQGAAIIVPCAIGVAIGGALLSTAPKIILHALDARDGLAPEPDGSAKRPKRD